MRFINLRRFFTITSGAIAIFSISSILALTYFSNKIESFNKKIFYSTTAVNSIHEFHTALVEYNRESMLFGLTGDPAFDNKRKVSLQNALNSLATAKETTSKKDTRKLNDIETEFQNYFNQRSVLEAEKKSVGEIALKVSPTIDKILNLTNKLINKKSKNEYKWTQEAASLASFAKRLAWSTIFIVILGVPFVWLFIRNFVYQPLIGVTDSLKAFRKGKILTPPATGLFELHDMSETISGMMHDLHNMREQQMQYLAAVAHDIRNPIAAIKISAELGCQQKIKNDEIAQYFDIIARQSQYLDQMVGDLLDTTCLEAGNLSLNIETCDLNNLIKNAALLFRCFSSKHNLTLHVSNELINCPIDPVRISQVINNLISNAIKYSPMGGEVVIEIKKVNNLALISVTDHGIGIAEEDHSGIFEPFKRSKRTSEKIPGVGLGLFTAKRIIEAHGGTISVISQIDKGSTFHVTLPCVSDQKQT